jgi:membrane-bound ClpP family serine protease
MLVSIIMAMVDIYPSAGLPTPMRFSVPVDKIVTTLTIALSFVRGRVGLSRVPKTPVYHRRFASASGEASVAVQEQQQTTRIGEVGVTASVLRPGGKARFGDQIIDVISQGEMVPKGSRVKIIGHSGGEAIVEAVTS